MLSWSQETGMGVGCTREAIGLDEDTAREPRDRSSDAYPRVRVNETRKTAAFINGAWRVRNPLNSPSENLADAAPVDTRL